MNPRFWSSAKMLVSCISFVTSFTICANILTFLLPGLHRVEHGGLADDDYQGFMEKSASDYFTPASSVYRLRGNAFDMSWMRF